MKKKNKDGHSDDEWKAVVAKWRADYDSLAINHAQLAQAARDAMRAFNNYVQYPQIRGETFFAEAVAASKRLEIALAPKVVSYRVYKNDQLVGEFKTMDEINAAINEGRL